MVSRLTHLIINKPSLSKNHLGMAFDERKILGGQIEIIKSFM